MLEEQPGGIGMFAQGIAEIVLMGSGLPPAAGDSGGENIASAAAVCEPGGDDEVGSGTGCEKERKEEEAVAAAPR